MVGPDPENRRYYGLGPTMHRVQTVAAFAVVWLISFQLGGSSVGALFAPIAGLLGSGLWYGIALVVCSVLLLLLNPRGRRRAILHNFRNAAPALALLVTLYGLLLASSAGTGWLRSLFAGDGLGSILLGLTASISQLILFVLLVVALVVALWHAAENRCRAHEVDPLLPSIMDIAVAAVLVVLGTVELAGTGNSSLLFVELGSAAVAMTFAVADLVIISQRPSY